MSERIKQLATEVGISVEYLNNTKQWELIEALAKLIVKECLTIVEGYCETSPEIYGLPLDILEHFDMELNDDQC